MKEKEITAFGAYRRQKPQKKSAEVENKTVHCGVYRRIPFWKGVWHLGIVEKQWLIVITFGITLVSWGFCIMAIWQNLEIFAQWWVWLAIGVYVAAIICFFRDMYNMFADIMWMPFDFIGFLSSYRARQMSTWYVNFVKDDDAAWLFYHPIRVIMWTILLLLVLLLANGPADDENRIFITTAVYSLFLCSSFWWIVCDREKLGRYDPALERFLNKK